VITADVQIAGRGSRGRKWLSPPGANLLASVILYPGVPSSRTVDMSFVAAVAVTRTLRNIGLDARIKWPNDVLVGGRKICGILIETVSRSGENPAVIVGIGINANWRDLDPEVAEIATSIVLELGRQVSVDDLLRSLLDELEPLYDEYLQSGLGGIMPVWRELHSTVGRDVTVLLGGESIKGKAVGVDDSGSLIVDTGSGLVTVTAAGTLLQDDHPEGRQGPVG
jgi:BirA family biotin operon repressor/biotin-[acetyl-CoA-carboxylase] ligase